jgi:hypothetical protein
MSDFLNGLERDLVDGMRRHESRSMLARILALPARVRWPHLLIAAGAAAAVLVIAFVELPSIGAGGGDIAVRTVALGGTYERDGFQLLVADGRYTLRGVAGANKVRTGRIAVDRGLATFSFDATCLSGGLDHGGIYRLRQITRGTVFELISDRCRSRANVLTGSSWSRGP